MLKRRNANRVFAARTTLHAVLLAAGIAMGTATFAQGSPPAATAATASTTKTLDRAQIDALLARPARILVIDVRRADEISSIGGFPIFLNVQAGDLERYLPYIPRDREIVTVSNHAHRAVRAGDVLAAKGFRVVGAAGAQDYEAQGGALTGKAAPPKVAAVSVAK